MSDPAPLACLTRALARHGLGAPLGVAVSGGGDSVAALVLAVEALGPGGVRAVSVDHGLRPGSAAEVAGVRALCDRLGVAHTGLRWSGPEGGNLQQAARRARRALIGDWARGAGVSAVVLAHSRDDQAETLLMRLARGSGVDGLSAMAEVSHGEGVLWLRPFLAVGGAGLRAVLRARGIDWVEDPSNGDARFLRVRARQALAALAPLGIDAAGLAATAVRLQSARAVLVAQAQAAMTDWVHEDRGTLRIAPAVLDLPGETRERLFAHLVRAVSGAEHPPRRDALRRWIEGRRGNFAGCGLRAEAAGMRLYREAKAVAELVVPSTAPWDGRWLAEGPHPAHIGALGRAGLAQLSAQASAGQHPHWRDAGLGAVVLEGLPGIWRAGALIAAPLAFWPQGWRLQARPVAAIASAGEVSH